MPHKAYLRRIGCLVAAGALLASSACKGMHLGGEPAPEAGAGKPTKPAARGPGAGAQNGKLPEVAHAPHVIPMLIDATELKAARAAIRGLSEPGAATQGGPQRTGAVDEVTWEVVRRAVDDADQPAVPERPAWQPAPSQGPGAAARAARDEPTVLISDESLLKIARDATRSDADAPVIVFRQASSRTDAEVRAALQQRISSLRVLHALPRNIQEAELVHPGRGRYFEPAYWSRIAGDLAATGVAISTPNADISGEAAADQITRWARSTSPTELLVLVGHVERDGTIPLADGSAVSVAQLSRESRAPIIFLGCRSLGDIHVAAAPAHVANTSVEASSYIGYVDDVDMVAAIAREVRSHPNASLRSLLKRFQLSGLLKTLVGVG